MINTVEKVVQTEIFTGYKNKWRSIVVISKKDNGTKRSGRRTVTKKQIVQKQERPVRNGSSARDE